MNDNKDLEALMRDNMRLCEALRETRKKLDEIGKILDGVSDLTVVREQTRTNPVTEEEVKSLLKKYSKIP